MYQPYGTMEEVAGIATPGADPERERFTGKEFDREGKDSANGIPGLNAYYFGARFHDPEIGMWMSSDPADQFWNTFSYTGGNPVNGVDPDGEETYYNSDGSLNCVMAIQDYSNPAEFIYNGNGGWNSFVVFSELNVTGFTSSNASSGGRPDSDGYITFVEALNWWKTGGGADVTADLGKLDLSKISASDFVDGNTRAFNLASPRYFSNVNDALVYGNVTLTLGKNNSVTARPDRYDFDMHHPLFSRRNSVRNFETAGARIIHGRGTAFNIILTGTGKIGQ